MTAKRILLVHEDRTLSSLFCEKLEGSGFAVDSARNLDQASRFVVEKKPDLVLLDLVSNGGSALGFIKELRSEAATASLPILIFPSGLTRLNNEAIQAGATRVVSRGNQTIASVIDCAKSALGLPGLGDAGETALFHPEESWCEMILQTAREPLNQMRRCLPGLVSERPDLSTLNSLWATAHAFAERVALLDDKNLAHFAIALDVLLAELFEFPEQINPSTTRTIGQAIDFMGKLAVPGGLATEVDIRKSRIVAVDDEDSARQFIAAALQLTHLRCEGAESPSAALEKLTGKPCDLIFLDVGLPEMTGFDLCAKIRALAAHEKTPIVFLTGMATFQNKAQANLSGGNDFIGKPFNLPELGLKALLWLLRGQLGLI